MRPVCVNKKIPVIPERPHSWGSQMSNSIIDEIFREIHRQNQMIGVRAIPHSDDFIKYICSSVAIEPELARNVIKILVNAHKIFSMEIVAEDKAREVPRVEGYVVAELAIIRKLKSFYQSELMIEYEKQFQKRMLIHQIVKEMLPIMKSMNNTSIGQLANKAIMLEEFERLLEKNFVEYTEDWKEKQLAIELGRANLMDQIPKKRTAHEAPEARSRTKRAARGARAVDSRKYEEFISRSKSYPLQKVLRIYGIQFFLQINLRKYQFEYLGKLVEDGQIVKRSDLTLLRDMLQTMKSNVEREPNLDAHMDELYRLERAVVKRLYFTPSRL